MLERLLRLDARLWVVAASLPLSAWAGFTATVPNDDAFVYIRTAEIFLEAGFGSGLAAAFAHYDWAGYPVLLGLAGTAGLELFTAAHGFNALFFALLSFAFVGICREFSADRGLLALAALTILLFPEINEYRYLVLRDTGFWAFTLLGLWWLVRYSAAGSWQACLGFCASLLLAALFRPEAALYALLAPLCLLWDRRHPRPRRMLLCGRAVAVALGGLLLALLAAGALGLDLPRQAVSLASAYAPFVQSLFDPAAGQAAAEAIFGEHGATWSGRYLPVFLVTGLLSILALELLYAVGMPFAPMLAWGWFKGWLLPDRNKALPIVAFAALNLLTVLIFILITRYLSSRYAMVFSLSLALAVPFTAREMLARMAPGTRLVPWLLALFFIFSAVDSYHTFGPSKSYVGDAVEWLDANGGAAAQLLTNNRAVAYHSGLVAEYDRVRPRLTGQEILATAPGGWIVVETSPAIEQLLARPDIAALLEPRAAFPDAQAPRMRVYRRR